MSCRPVIEECLRVELLLIGHEISKSNGAQIFELVHGGHQFGLSVFERLEDGQAGARIILTRFEVDTRIDCNSVFSEHLDKLHSYENLTDLYLLFLQLQLLKVDGVGHVADHNNHTLLSFDGYFGLPDADDAPASLALALASFKLLLTGFDSCSILLQTGGR